MYLLNVEVLRKIIIEKIYFLLILNPKQNLGIKTMKFQMINSNPSFYKKIQIIRQEKKDSNKEF